MRLFLAVLICKILRFALRVLGRGGTAMPGRIALKLCPDMLSKLSKDVKTVAVTGTNGKTTTCRMIEHMLEENGEILFANRSGSNLEQGIAADFAANASLFGKPKKKTAVIECDEAAFRKVCGELKPAAVVVTNVFRDQLDRYGEVTHTLDCIREGLLSSPDSLVCLNADCSLTASLGRSLPNRLRFFGLDVPLGERAEISDAPRCIFCGAEYEYAYHTFAHLGGFRCTQCGYSRREPDVAVTAVNAVSEDGTDAALKVDGTALSLRLGLPGEYNLYNAAAAVAACTALGEDAALCVRSLENLESGFGRMERFSLGGADIRMILVKNPAGCDRGIDYLRTLPEGTTAVFCLNDAPADGTDISWIWDVSFERLFDEDAHTPELIVSGTRAEDMRLRLKYAGADETRIRLIRGEDGLLKAMSDCRGRVCVLPTYTAMLPLRAALARAVGRKEFWK